MHPKEISGDELQTEHQITIGSRPTFGAILIQFESELFDPPHFRSAATA